MLLTLLLPAVALAKQVKGPLALVLSGEECPSLPLSAGLEQAVARELAAGKPGSAVLPAQEVAGALARARADRALTRARQLYTKANFAGCISLLSITEQELGRHLAARDAVRQAQAHRLLGQVNLWLGICQWAAGDPQPAAASFVRATRLPGAPAPDPALLPPELVAAFQAAVAVEQPQLSCTLGQALLAQAPLRLTIDGREVVDPASGFTVSAGTHYLALHAGCGPECALSQLLGPGGQRSLRLVASAGSCQLDLSPPPAAAGLPCLSPSEADDPTMLAALTRESGAAGTLALVHHQGKVALRLQCGRRPDFLRQLSAQVEPGETVGQVIGQSLGLVLGGEQPAPPPLAARPWYRQWWVWALAGTVVAASAATGTYLLTRDSDRVTVIFGP